MSRESDRCLSSLSGEIEDLEKRIQELERELSDSNDSVKIQRDEIESCHAEIEELKSERETTSLKFQELEAANFALTEENQRLKEHLSPK